MIQDGPRNAMVYILDRRLVQEAIVLLCEERGWHWTLWIRRF